ncbi:MAG: glycosyltransferase 87 family protein [Frankiaceae bacterium]|nr:glycosyltransferase 87 family protein [Frankiaceae bacterium]
MGNLSQRRPQLALRRAPVQLLGPLYVLAVVLLAVLARRGQPLAVDVAVHDALVVAKDAQLAAVLTQLGSGALLYPLLIILAGLRSRRGLTWVWALLPVAVLGVAQMTEAVAFVTLSRPGPDGLGVTTFSSGQAMAAVLGWGMLAAHRRTTPTALGTGVAAVAGTVGLTRLLLNEHWATDVLAGWAFGVLALGVFLRLDRRMTPTRHVDHTLVVEGSRPATAGAWRASRWAWVLPGAAALVPLVPLLTVPAPERMKDLLVYVGAGGVAGRGADVYDFRTAFDMPFTYPPFAAVLSEPLARVPLPLLHALWAAATLAALVAVARVAMQPIVLRLGLPITLMLLLISSPVRSHLRFGQVGLFLVLLVAADLLHDHRSRGTGVGLAAAVKLTPAVFLPWLLLTRQWTTLRSAVLTAAGATTLGLLLLWPSAHEYLWRALWDSSRFGPNDIPGNQSVRGMLLRSPLDDHTAQWIWGALALLLLTAATLGARRLHAAGNQLGAVGVLAAASVAVSPISWVHHLVWLVLPLSALVAAGHGRLAAAWAGLLIVSLPSIGSAGLRSDTGHPLLWHLLIDVQGLTAIAAVLLLPTMLSARATRRVPGARAAEPSGTEWGAAL